VAANAVDSLSGLANVSCGALDTSTAGVKSVTCTATNNAGESDSATVNYTVNAPVGYIWSGFFQPVDNLPTLNQVKAGQAIPVKFSLGGTFGLSIFASGYPVSQQIVCGTSVPIDDIEQTVAAGSSSLSYDPSSGQYSYIWKTEKTWVGQCRHLVIRLSDGSEHAANFKLK
jgi:hypothetical protein